jgi:lysophospholipase L1-like esterase
MASSMPRARVLLVVVALFGLVALPDRARSQGAPDPSRFESEIHAFETADLSDPPPRGGIIFSGSSSIRLWTTLKEDFAGLPVVNRGFGGSMLPEVTAFLDRIVIPHKPALVVIYCGGNDINAGRSAEQVTADFKALVAVLHDALPLTRIDYISIAPNPARWSQVETVKRANREIAEYVATDSRLAFIDVFPRMLGPDGKPKPDIFVEDQLHMNAAGYAIWTEVIRPYLILRRP